MSLSQQISNRFGKKGYQSEYDDDALIDIHHLFMKEYGWIPIEEFKNLPLPTLHNLLDCIRKEKELEKAEYEKAKRKRR